MDYKQSNDDSPTSSRLNNSSLIAGHRPVEDLDYSCGLFSFRPNWLQRLARKQIFLLIFCLTSVFQGMYFTYIVSVITTIEKLYRLPSRTTGFIISSVEIGQISGSLTLAYFGGKSHRPRWIGFGILLFAFANILCSSPHFLLPTELERSTSALRPVAGQSNLSSIASERLAKGEFFAKEKLCSVQSDGFLAGIFKASSPERPSDAGDQTAKCQENHEQTTSKNKITFLATCIFFTAAILVGFGTTAVNTLGIPFLDDNVAAKESPLYFAITIGIKIFGPVLGFLLGSLCTSIYVDFPWDNGHGLTPSHPEWVGAWWLGVFMLGTVITFNSIFMMSFPKKLPSKKQLAYSLGEETDKFEEKTYKAKANDDEPEERYSKLHVDSSQLTSSDSKLNNNDEAMNCCSFNKPTIGDDSAKSLDDEQILTDQKLADRSDRAADDSSFLRTIERLLRNRILLCRIASTVFHILPVSGLYTFLPKYLEYQYRITASDASFISGIAGIMVMGLGIFSSGIYMRRANPNPNFVSKWICIATFLYVCGMISLIFLGCPLPKISGLTEGALDVRSNCPSCQCESNQFMPICASNAVTYLSPCLAGCTRFNRTGNEYNYLDCRCLPERVEITKNGFCGAECNNLLWYIILFSTIALLHSTTEVGAMLLTLRSVHQNDKTVALGLVAFVSSLLGSFPCAIIYGAFIDTACLFWQTDCSGNGACRLYDSDKFRVVIHGLTAFFMFCAFLFDVCVFAMSSRISFLEESSQDELMKDGMVNDSLVSDNLSDDVPARRVRSNTNDTNNNSKDDRAGLLNEEIGSSGLKRSLEDTNNNRNLLIEDCKIPNIQAGESLPLSS